MPFFNSQRLLEMPIKDLSEQLSPTLPTVTVNKNEVVIRGKVEYGYLGYAVSDAGDVNGDGYPDFLIGSGSYDNNGFSKTYLLWGGHVLSSSTSGAAAPKVSISPVQFVANFSSNMLSGPLYPTTLSGAGDVNGDGYDDIVIGVSRGAEQAGQAYLIFGQKDWSGVSSVTLDDLGSSSNPKGIIFDGIGGQAGYSVSGGGDINHDGFSDFIIGAPFINQAYLIFGQSNLSVNTPVSLGAIGSNSIPKGVTFSANYDSTGFSVSEAGDVNNDGYDDLLIGAVSSKAYLILGQGNWSGINSVSLDALGTHSNPQGVIFEIASSQGDISVSGSEDVDNDGYDDFLISVPSSYVYLVLGQGNWSTNGTISINTLGSHSNPQGVVFNTGEEGFASTYISVNRAGNVNDDQYADFLIGLPHEGKAYLILGQSNWSGNSTISLESLGANTHPQGIMFKETNGETQLGFAVSSLGDINADGISDFAIGAPETRTGDIEYAGAAFLFLGQESWDGRSTILLNTDQKIDLLPYAYDGIGFSVSGAGDVNGDGYDDFLIGAPGAKLFNDGLPAIGKTYLLFGPWKNENTFLTKQSLDALVDQAVLFVYASAHFTRTNIFIGCSVGGVGDVNGDGYDDFLISGAAHLAGDTYLVFGQQDWSSLKQVSLSELSNDSVPKGQIFVGGVFGGAGGNFEAKHEKWCHPVSGAGDVNRDGYDDFMIGNPMQPDSFFSAQGKAYLLFGQAYWNVNHTISLNSLGSDTTPRAVAFETGDSDAFGYSLSGVGDVDKDGYPDLLIGAPYAKVNSVTSAGKAYLVFGQAAWNSTSILIGSQQNSNNPRVFTFERVAIDDKYEILDDDENDNYLGFSVSGAGDVNRDGYADFMLGVPGASGENGGVYLLLGQQTWTGNSTLNLNSLSNITSPQATVFTYEHKANLGYSVSNVGDVNKDGYDDVLLGGPEKDWSSAFLVLGQESWDINAIELSDLGANSSPRGIIFAAEDDDETVGYSVSGAGDVNGDGYNDFLIGNPSNDDTGTAYLFFGQSNWDGNNPVYLGGEQTFYTHSKQAAYFTPNAYAPNQRRLLMIEEVASATTRLKPFGATFYGSVFKVWDSVLEMVLYSGFKRSVSENVMDRLYETDTTEARGVVRYYSTSDVAFDHGEWDEYPSLHALTGRPVFTYRVFKGAQEVGHATFYNHPLLCRGASDATRHNLLSVSGVLSKTNIEEALSRVEEICAELPPTYLEELGQAVQSAAGHGAIRGVARLAEEFGVPSENGQLRPYLYSLVYYGLWFGTRLLSHYQTLSAEKNGGVEEEETASTLYEAGVQAAVDTAGLAMTNTVINTASRLVGWLGEQASQSGWRRLGGGLSWLSHHSSALVFAKNSYSYGIAETGSRMVAGVVAEEAVVRSGRVALGFFGKSQMESQRLTENCKITKAKKC